jgi:aminomethyltransferase
MRLARSTRFQPKKLGRGYCAPVKRTALYDLHVGLKAKMVPFAGWDMPVQYPEGVLASHLHTRSKAGLFDVSHMGQLKITGKDRNEFIEWITVVDTQLLKPFHGAYSLIPNESGGLIDDTIVTNAGDFLYVVVNAGCYDKDMIHIRAREKEFRAKGKDVQVQDWENRSLLALQGPAAESILQKHTEGDLSKLTFFTGGFFKVDGALSYIQRSGYTGEDGFEVSIPTPSVVSIAKGLLAHPEVMAVGLGARDSLRLEAGLSLYGHELDEETTPKEANLVWTISKRRQAEGGFIGDKRILAQLPGKIGELKKRRVGLIVEGAPAREHTTIHSTKDQSQIGHVTSGTHSPVLKKSIAMAYVAPPHHMIDTEVLVNIRGTMRKAVVTKVPFVPTNYKTE